MADHLKALTIRQPFASLVMAGVKTTENRTWRTNYRGRLLIHAGARDDREAMAQYGHLLDDYPRGAILGTVELFDCVRDSESEWAMVDHWHWLLGDPHPFETPVPAKGKLGLWTYFVDDGPYDFKKPGLYEAP
ncbi:MAG: ASCH domain-containing protein [Acidimicrobiales bacterium]